MEENCLQTQYKASILYFTFRTTQFGLKQQFEDHFAIRLTNISASGGISRGTLIVYSIFV